MSGKQQEINTELVNKLAKQFAFDPEVLRKELRLIKEFLSLDAFISGRIPTAKERKRKLTALKTQVTKLRISLLELPGATYGVLESELGSRTEPTENFTYPSIISEMVCELGSTTERTELFAHPSIMGEMVCETMEDTLKIFSDAIDAIMDKSLDRRINPKQHLQGKAIKEIAKLWTKLTGRAASFTTCWSSGKRSGEFISFLVSASVILGIYPGPMPERFVILKKQNPHF